MYLAIIGAACSLLTFTRSVTSAPAQPAPDYGDDLLELLDSDEEASPSLSSATALWEERGGHFEGDMVLTEQQRRAVDAAVSDRNGLRDPTTWWPEATVRYHIQCEDFDEDQVKMIEAAIEDISANSCVKFRPRKNDSEHAVIIQEQRIKFFLILKQARRNPRSGTRGTAGGCFSSVGVSDTSQRLNLARGCFKHGTIVHELLHTLGFYHMQSSYDRDDYVTILWENILEGTEHNFAKYTNTTVTDFDVQYDYGSVMHYPEKAFSKTGNRTIVPLQEGVTIGQRVGMSPGDVRKLNLMYCGGGGAPPISRGSPLEY